MQLTGFLLGAPASPPASFGLRAPRRQRCRRSRSIVLFSCLALAPHSFAGFTNTSPMTTPRVLHTATLLPNGKVLVAGGAITNRPFLPTATAELYNRSSGTWTATPPMSAARINHTATLLPDGNVLVTGGRGDKNALSSTELYNPTTGTWRNAASMNAPRNLATATLLPNGKVLVIGGDSGGTIELYNPATDTWTPAGAMKSPRQGHTTTLLSDGRVFVVGGFAGMGMVQFNGVELFYNPSNGVWSAAGPLNYGRRGYTATFLPDGKVLVVGGGQPRPSLATAELFDPATARWSLLVNHLKAARQFHTATLLRDGTLLVAGGYEHTNASPTWISRAELLDPASGKWIDAGNLHAPRYNHTATLLPDGQVVLAGGWGTNGVLASVELYVPADAASQTNPLAAIQYAHIPTLPPGKFPQREQTAAEALLSNATYQASALGSSVRDKLEQMHANATEPKYKGQPLSYWLADVQVFSSAWPTPLKPEAKTAVAQIGTNAIPFLLDRMGSSSSMFDDSGAIQAFAILGPAARSAIPALARMATNQPAGLLQSQEYDQSHVTLFGQSALMALGGIGPDALPALLTILTNAIAPGTRLGAIQAIAGMGTNAAAAVPTVLRYVEDKNDMVASQAVNALGAIGPGDPAALAALEKTALGPRQPLQSNALEALRNFGDQATPALIRALGETNRGSGYPAIAFHMLAFSTPTALTNAEVIRIAAEALQSSDPDRREWSAYVLRAIGQQASGTKPDFMMPISRQDLRFEDATNVLRRLAPELLP